MDISLNSLVLSGVEEEGGSQGGGGRLPEGNGAPVGEALAPRKRN